MNLKIDLGWFKIEFESLYKDFDVQSKFYENGDFGSLNQIEFNSFDLGGVIDFWSSGWVGIHLVNYLTGDELMNLFLEPSSNEDKVSAFKELKSFIY